MADKKTNTDYLTEMLTGEKGAVRCIGKFIISPRNQKIEEMPLHLIAGSAVCPTGLMVLPENAKYNEMWECEIILIPKRKYSGLIKGIKGNSGDNVFDHAFSGCRIDQILCSNFGSPESWGKKYFDYKD